MDALWADTIDDWTEVRAEAAGRRHGRLGQRGGDGPASADRGGTSGHEDAAGGGVEHVPADAPGARLLETLPPYPQFDLDVAGRVQSRSLLCSVRIEPTQPLQDGEET